MSAEAIGASSFLQAMQGFAPFEAAPVVAVGVSGGPDSMALLVLLDSWARDRGGSVVGLTVDHGLRPESTAEARQVGEWSMARGILHMTLIWQGEKPKSGIHQAARDARYALMAEACAARGILHLAIAHHADDQAETVLFRRQRGSGPNGLAGMPASRSLGAVRLIRPLLAWRKEALIATCAAFGQPVLDDPSNRAEKYGRTAIRRFLADRNEDRENLLRDAAAAAAAATRAASENRLSALLGRIAEIRPDGTVILDTAGLAAAEPDVRQAALAAILRSVGGEDYAADADALERLDGALRAKNFRGASLAGCLVRPWRGKLLICREAGRIGPPEILPAGRWRRWDGRFLIRAAAKTPDRPLEIGPLGRAGYAEIRRQTAARLPSIAASSLPAIRQGSQLLAVPGLGWNPAGIPAVEQRLAPRWPAVPETFTVVCNDPGIICGTVGKGTGGGIDPIVRSRSLPGF